MAVRHFILRSVWQPDIVILGPKIAAMRFRDTKMVDGWFLIEMCLSLNEAHLATRKKGGVTSRASHVRVAHFSGKKNIFFFF